MAWSIVPGDPAKSPLYTATVLPLDDDNKMPPKDETLTKAQTETLRLWIKQGANWPDSVTLVARKVEAAATGDEPPPSPRFTARFSPTAILIPRPG